MVCFNFSFMHLKILFSKLNLKFLFKHFTSLKLLSWCYSDGGNYLEDYFLQIIVFKYIFHSNQILIKIISILKICVHWWMD